MHSGKAVLIEETDVGNAIPEDCSGEGRPLYFQPMTSAFNERVENAVKSIRAISQATPKVGLVLGSGLSGLAESFGGQVIPFGSISGFPAPTVHGHAGILRLSDTFAIFAGRFHYYEGHGMDAVVLPTAVLSALGVKVLILTNAAGGVHFSYKPGDIALISDHINLQGTNALIGPNVPALGPRFPDMTEVYSSRLRSIARETDPHLREGVYAAFTGPSYETPAEIRFARAIGADLVGMSTVPEATVAKSAGLEVLGISVVTNLAAGLGAHALSHAEVIETGKLAEARLSKLLHALVEKFAKLG